MASSSLKWAGNKAFIAKHLERLLHNEFPCIDDLIVMEPFIGSAGFSLYFEFKNVIANDLYPPLIHYYDTIKKDGIKLYETKADEETYLLARAKFNSKVERGEFDAEMADMLLFINRTCYNGLIRTNLKGGINTPVGRYDSFPKWSVDLANQHKEIIENWELHTGCFTKLPTNRKVDLLYLDPPYAGKKMFTTYAGKKFTSDMQNQVIEFADQFPSDTRVIISNSVQDRTLLKNYKKAGFKLYTVKVTRTISSKSSERKPVDEVIALKNFNTLRVGALCERLQQLNIRV